MRPKRWAKSESQIGIDLLAMHQGDATQAYCDTATRQAMADAGLGVMTSDVHHPCESHTQAESDMHLIVL